jgi:hypothetical protein
MSKTSEDDQDGLQSSSGSLPNLQLAVNRRSELRLPASMSPSYNAVGGISNPSNLKGGRTSLASDAERVTFYHDLTLRERDPLQPSIVLPVPWRHHEEPLQPKPASRSMGSTTSISSPSNFAQYDMRATWRQVDRMDDESSGRLHNALRTLSTNVLAARIANKEDSTVVPTPGQQSQPISRSTDLGLSLGLRLPSSSGIASDDAEGRLTKLVEVRPVNSKEGKDNRKEPESGQSSAASAGTKRKRGSLRPIPPAPRTTKTNQRPGRKYEMQWRVGQAPTKMLKDTKEQANFERVLTAISRYYQGNADDTWKTALRQNASEYDGKGLTEAFGASTTMAAGLIAAGQAHNATQILNRMLSLAQVMLLSQHPQVCFWLIEVSMDTSETAVGNVRRAIKSQFAPLACRLLGEDHPLSLLLRTPLTTEQQARIRREGQAVVHDYHVRTFGSYSYQTMSHQWIWGRIAAASGHFEEAIRLFQDFTQTWEQVYSTPNSAVAVGALIEQARVMVASGDASVKVECLLSDALRRIDVLSSTQILKIPIMDVAELRLREGGMIFARLAALRTLGRVHIMRGNLSAALVNFEQATAIAEAQLTEQSSVRKLCETDLEVAQMMELERAMGMLSVDDPTSRLPPISSIVSLLPVER